MLLLRQVGRNRFNNLVLVLFKMNITFIISNQTFARTSVNCLYYINELLLILDRPVYFVVVSSSQINHDMLVAKEEHHLKSVLPTYFNSVFPKSRYFYFCYSEGPFRQFWKIQNFDSLYLLEGTFLYLRKDPRCKYRQMERLLMNCMCWYQLEINARLSIRGVS